MFVIYIFLIKQGIGTNDVIQQIGFMAFIDIWHGHISNIDIWHAGRPIITFD